MKTNKGYKNTQMKKESKGKRIITDILLVVFLLIAIGSGAYIAIYYYNSVKNEKQFDNLKENIIEDDSDEEGQLQFIDVQVGDEKIKILKRYSLLYGKNPDFIGWLKIEGTKIDYPVMYTPSDEEYYIHRNFDQEYSSAGTLFIDTSSVPTGRKTDNILIYGHNMKSGTMFSGLLDYASEDFYQGHKYIKFDTLEEIGTYEVIAAFHTRVYSDDDTDHYHYYDFFNARNAEEFDEYVQYVKSNTPYTIPTTAEYGDQLITLSTCAYHVNDGRYVVVAKKIEE